MKDRLTPAQTEIQKWTAEEFERLVFESKPKVAVFDCDGTLWSGDAGYGFMAWSLEQGLVSRSTRTGSTRGIALIARADVSEVAICGEMVQMYAGLRDGSCAMPRRGMWMSLCAGAFSRRWSRWLPRCARPGIGALGGELDESLGGRRGLRDFEIPEERILAAEVRVEGRNHHERDCRCADGRGEGDALKRVGLPKPDAVFGNSIHDLAMLEMARCAFPVNPSPALLEAAAKRGWGYFRPKAAEGVESAVAGE